MHRSNGPAELALLKSVGVPPRAAMEILDHSRIAVTKPAMLPLQKV
jgi:hypothetical protein